MKNTRTKFLLLWFGVFIPQIGLSEESWPTAILGAFDQEIAILKQNLTDAQEVKIQGLRFLTGKLENREVVVALTGVGKVNAAMTTSLLIDHFQPREIIFSGIAGGLNPDLQPGDIVIGRSASQHDYGLLTEEGIQNGAPRNPATGKRNPVHIPADARLLEIAQRAEKYVRFDSVPVNGQERFPKVVQGIIATGDVFIASSKAKADIRKRLKADVVEMEGAAVAQVCHQLKTPFLAIRSISDLADEKAPKDMATFYQTAANNSAKLVTEIVKKLAPGESVSKKTSPNKKADESNPQ